MVQAGEGFEPVFAEQREVHRKGESAQALIGADIRGRLFAADVLFAGGQGQDEPALAIGIHGFPAQAARHLPDVFFTAGEEAQMWPAERHGNTDGLRFAAHDVGLHRRRQQTQR